MALRGQLQRLYGSERCHDARRRSSYRREDLSVSRLESDMSEPWDLDTEGKRLWDARDPTDCWNVADRADDRAAVRDYLNDLERRLAAAEEALRELFTWCDHRLLPRVDQEYLRAMAMARAALTPQAEPTCTEG